MKLKEIFFVRDARTVARDLLGKVLVRRINRKILKSKIVETEAYFDENDPASKASKRKGDLKTTMLMPSGTILVYGIHNNWLINFVTNSEGKAEAVLLRALEPLNFDGNCKGPGLLTKTLKIDKSFHKKNIIRNNKIFIEENDPKEKFEIYESFRIGVTKDLPEKLRFYIKGNKNISRK